MTTESRPDRSMLRKISLDLQLISAELMRELTRQEQERHRSAEVWHEMATRVQYLVDWADGLGLLEERCFTFPDGDTWHAGDKSERPETAS